MAKYVCIKKNLKGYVVTCSDIQFKNSYSLKKIYDKKLDNSISRAKSVVRDLVLNNDFKYFVTLTIKSKYNNLTLEQLKRNINERVKYMRKKGFFNLGYILIPELTKNGNLHFHGFFNDGFTNDLYYNDNNYLSLNSFDSLGFTSISRISNFDACCNYILKYINKDMCKALKGQHLYFCSKGLNRSKRVLSFYGADLQPLYFNFKNQFITKSLLNHYDFINYIDFINKYNKIYYVISNDDKLSLEP